MQQTRGVVRAPKHGVNSRNEKSIVMSILSPMMALIGLYIFSSAFFLAKRSMPHVSACEKDSASSLLQDWLGLSVEETERLHRDNLLSIGENTDSGCWMNRRVSSMVVLVVDALRFDFARYHLPKSLGSRLDQSNSTYGGRSQLLKFVADPPTVTMQRLKGLTTGGLPTFADISGSFGGADVDEDSWVQQLKVTPASRRGFPSGSNEAVSKLAFVGDDTWVDLFPTQFDDSHPYPSFNTRDMDTVDNGCLLHLPRLMQSLGGTEPKLTGSADSFEVIVTHFLGVDHVGHTYGPNNIHMEQKLQQMDKALSAVLDQLDDPSSKSCQVAFIFGDHGMTEDGNHGGGTEDEINAALFAHFSPGCGDMSSSLDLTGSEVGMKAEEAFQSMHQIDLVPTISLLLGLPIPYASLGGLVTSLLPPMIKNDVQTPSIATALALNAAQVWRYFSVYSKTANKLPSLPELELLLQDAVSVYKTALSQEGATDSLAYREACGKFKLFLLEATELGKRVWTRFDSFGMTVGGSILLLALLLGIPLWNVNITSRSFIPRQQYLEVALTMIFMIFHCVILTFSNSYIGAERSIIMFFLTIICVVVSCRRSLATSGGTSKLVKENSQSTPYLQTSWIPLAIPVATRISELFVSGHGLDPAIPLHLAHNSGIFLSSLATLAFFRWMLYRRQIVVSLTHAILDISSLSFLSLCWLEKRNPDVSRNGYMYCQSVMLLLATGTLVWGAGIFLTASPHPTTNNAKVTNNILAFSCKLMIFIMTVTGPSTAASSVLFIITAWVLYRISGILEFSPCVVAALWRLIVRQVFFNTGHACAFNMLQYSAAFVATMEFDFIIGGISLFLNTFGWEILGLILVSLASNITRRPTLWDWYCFYQLMESFGACVSVTLMRRHLMVWAVFAPRFLFAAIFLVLNSMARLIVAVQTQ